MKYMAIVPGMNHMQVAGLPPLLLRGDIESEKSREAITEDLAKLISAFIEANFGEHNTEFTAVFWYIVFC